MSRVKPPSSKKETLTSPSVDLKQAAQIVEPALLEARPWLKYYDVGVPPTVPITERTLPQVLRETAQKFPTQTAIIFFGHKLTYREVDDAADKFAAGLTDIGIKPGDRVALMLPNCPQFVIAFFGALRAGAIVVPCNPTYVARELETQLNNSGAKVIVTLTLFYKMVRGLQPRTHVQRIIAGNIKDYFPTHLKTIFTVAKEKKEGHRANLKSYGVYSWLEFLEAYPLVRSEITINPDDVALYQYTGGTTGIPKGAMLTHRNLVTNIDMGVSWMGVRERGKDICLCAIPFFHSYGLSVAMGICVATGSAMLLLPRFNVNDVLKAISRYKPELFPGVPAMYIALLNHKDLGKYDLSSIEICLSGASALPADVQNRFEKLTGAKLVEGFGMTECSPVSHGTPIFGKRKEGSIGIPFPGIEAKIVDIETGEQDLPIGEVGELVIKGPTVMQGYYLQPDENAKTIRNGWLFTGDIARMDEDGFFFIVDRKKDMILSNGFNVYPREVEEILFTHAAVKDAIVIGAPNERGDTTVKAYLILKEGATATEEEIIEFCRENMARYKAPRHVEFRDSLPKTLIGKPLRRVLVAEEEQKIAHKLHLAEEAAALDTARELMIIQKFSLFNLHLPRLPLPRRGTDKIAS